MGMNVVSAGIFVSLAALISGPGVLLGGYLSDLMGKKTIIVTGQLLSATMIICCSFWSGTITVGYLLIAVMFFISITRPAYNALIIQLCTEEKERKSAFSLMYLGANLGIAIGPLVAGFFIKDHIHIVFISISTVFLISTFIIINQVKIGTSKVMTSTDSKNSVHLQTSQPPTPLFRLLMKNPLVALFILVSFLNYFIYMQSSFSLPLQMNDSFGEDGAAYYGSVMTINAISVIILTTLILSVTRKLTALNSIATGALFYGIGFGALSLMGYFPHFAIVAVSTVLWTVGEILVQTNINLYIASRVPDTHQGRFNGLLLFIGCLGYTLSPYLTGIFIKNMDMGSLWIIILAFSLVYALCMIILWYIEKSSTRKSDIEPLDLSQSV